MKQKKKRKIAEDTSYENHKQLLSERLVCRRTMKTKINPSVRNNTPFQLQDKIHLSRPSVSKSAAQDIPARREQSRSEENLGSKRRAKARRQGGLQAMLDRSKMARAEVSEPRLDLMDLMRSS